jgi:hypothetical protein
MREGTLDPCLCNDNVPIRVSSLLGTSAYLPWPLSVSCVAYLNYGILCPKNVMFPLSAVFLCDCGARWSQKATDVSPLPLCKCARMLAHAGLLDLSVAEYNVGTGPFGSLFCPKNKAFYASCERLSIPFGCVISARSSGAASIRNATWLILPVVICLSQRLSHACVSMN